MPCRSCAHGSRLSAVIQTFIQAFEAVAVLLGIGLLGFSLLSRRVLPGEALRFLSILALDVSLPCLVFVRITRQFEPSTYPKWWLMPFAWLVFTVALAVFVLAAMRVSRPRTRREFGMTLFYQNATFVPLVILAEMWGSDSRVVVLLFLFVMFFSAFLFSTYGLFFGRARHTPGLGKVVHPVLLVTVAAILTKMTGLQDYVPAFALRALAMVGQMTVPLLMLILGGSIYLDLRQGAGFEVTEVAKFVVLKNLVLPAVTLCILALIRPPTALSFIIFLESAMPPVTAAPVLAQRAGGNSAIVSQFLVASFAFSLLSIPGALAFYQLFFPLP